VSCSNVHHFQQIFLAGLFNASIMGKQLTASLAPGIWHPGEQVSPSD